MRDDAASDFHGTGASIVAVYGDGKIVPTTTGEAAVLVAVARDTAATSNGPTMPPSRACEACGKPTHKGYQWCEACAAAAEVADAAEAKASRVTAIATVAKAAPIDVSAADVIPPGTMALPGDGLVFTAGYDGRGFTAAMLGAIMAECRIGKVIDTRIESTTRAHGWSEKALRTALGSAYVVAQGRGAVADAIKAAGRTNVLLLRKEEAPGDSAYALELARMFPTTIHVFRNEYIAGTALQEAIDKDRATGGDHAYPCIVEDGIDDEAQGAEKASA